MLRASQVTSSGRHGFPISPHLRPCFPHERIISNIRPRTSPAARATPHRWSPHAWNRVFSAGPILPGWHASPARGSVLRNQRLCHLRPFGKASTATRIPLISRPRFPGRGPSCLCLPALQASGALLSATPRQLAETMNTERCQQLWLQASTSGACGKGVGCGACHVYGKNFNFHLTWSTVLGPGGLGPGQRPHPRRKKGTSSPQMPLCTLGVWRGPVAGTRCCLGIWDLRVS